MKLTQVITRSSLAAVALLNLSLATSAAAESIVVTRGPNGAAHVVKSDNVPIDAKLMPDSEAREFPQLVKKGPSGAAHIVKKSEPIQKTTQQSQKPQLVRRGTHGAFFISNQ